jgi:hypothetical protein
MGVMYSTEANDVSSMGGKDGAVGVETARDIPTHAAYVLERIPSKFAMIASDIPSVSTSIHSLTPRSSHSTNSNNDELLVIRHSQDGYINHNVFDKAMHERDIDEEVPACISRMSTTASVLSPDPQYWWESSGLDVSPVRCSHRQVEKECPRSPLASTPSSMPATPESTNRELDSPPTCVPVSIPSMPESTIDDTADESLIAAKWVIPTPMSLTTCSSSCAWYQVSLIGGLSIREGPGIKSHLTGKTLACNDMFAAVESTCGLDERVYLKLADDSGWVHDDTLLFPSHPSVIKLPFAANSPHAFFC